MRMNRQTPAMRHLRTLFDAGAIGGLTDGQLLQRFLTRGGETAELAFSALVERHGAMVQRVCRGVLRDANAADDAFQATFLVLVRKAAQIQDRARLGNWLHGVALRVSANALTARLRRRLHEQRAAEPEGTTDRDTAADELVRAIHEEVGRLPDRYRGPLVLCCLQGESYIEAARQLDLPVGTLKSRLARGRDRLKDRLTRRGLAPTGAVVGAFLAADTSRGAVQAPLIESTTQAAIRVAASPTATLARLVPASIATMTEGVLSAMLWTKLKIAATAAGVALLLVVGNAGLMARQSQLPGSSDAAQGGGDRLKDVERKLDRLIQAIERNNVATGNFVADVVPDAANPNRVDPSTGVLRDDESAAKRARLDRAHIGYDVKGLGIHASESDGRIAALERKVVELQRRIDQLEQRGRREGLTGSDGRQ